jgi:hypothetical protein
MEREDELNLKEWISDPDLNNLIERETGLIESKRMNKRFGSKLSHTERDRG